MSGRWFVDHETCGPCKVEPAGVPGATARKVTRAAEGLPIRPGSVPSVPTTHISNRHRDTDHGASSTISCVPRSVSNLFGDWATDPGYVTFSAR